MESIKVEQALLAVVKIQIDFSPVLFITRSMETYEGEY